MFCNWSHKTLIFQSIQMKLYIDCNKHLIRPKLIVHTITIFMTAFDFVIININGCRLYSSIPNSLFMYVYFNFIIFYCIYIHTLCIHYSALEKELPKKLFNDSMQLQFTRLLGI